MEGIGRDYKPKVDIKKKESKIYLVQNKGSCQARKLALDCIFFYFIWPAQLSHLGASKKKKKANLLSKSIT